MTLPTQTAGEDEAHRRFMARALALARRAEGFTSPNPMVGAVIVRDGRIIGEGYHHRAGLPHAEIEALRSAREDVRGAVMYVTLEPCCHHGRTPPCSQALIDAGIGTVYYAVGDDNPKVEGGGCRQLCAAGINTYLGPLTEEARHLNRAFFHFITRKRPYVIAKYAMSLDGRIATHTGSSQWITGAEARTRAHQLRQFCDAILVGSGTVLADDPSLTTRLTGVDAVAHGLRVILDRRGRCPLSAKVFDPALPGQTLVVGGVAVPAQRRVDLRERGIDFVAGPAPDDGCDLEALMPLLAERGIVSLMVEGGAAVLGSFFSAGLIDEIWAFIGAKVIGGRAAPGPIGGLGINDIGEAEAWSVQAAESLGRDVLVRACRDQAP